MNNRIIALCLLGFFSFLLHSENVENSVINLKDKNWKEIVQSDDYFLATPSHIALNNKEIFVFDRKLYKILVIKNDKISHYLGSAGQGPGELFNPVSIKLYNDRLYVFNRNLSIYSFDNSGAFREEFSSLKSSLNANSISVSDFDIYKEEIFVAVEGHKYRIWVFDNKGLFLRKFLEDEHYKEPRKGVVFTKPSSIVIDQNTGMCVVVDKFSGEVVWINGNNDKIVSTKQIPSDTILENVNKARKIENEPIKTAFADFKSVSQIGVLHSRGIDLIYIHSKDALYEISINKFTIKKCTVLLDNERKKYRLLKTAEGYLLIDMDDSSIWAIN